MPTYRIEINGRKVDVQAGSPEEIPDIYNKLKDVIPTKEAANIPEGGPFERPPGELQTQPFFGNQAREEANLNRNVPPELIAELRQAQTGEAPTQTEVESFKKAAGSRSTRDFFNNLVSQGAIDLGSSFNPEQSPTLAGAWEKYKQEMEPSFFGAMARGAAEQIAPAIGGLAGGALAGTLTANPIVGIAGGVAGAKAGAELQQEIFPPTQAELAQRRFDEARTGASIGRTIGSFAPSVATGVPSASRIAGIAGVGSQAAVAAARSMALREGAIGAGASFAAAGMEGRLPTAREIAEGAIMGAITRPTDFGTAMMMPRKQRTELAGRRSAEQTVQEFAGGEKPAELAATAIEQGIPTSPGATFFAGEISGNEGLLGLQEALMSTSSGLRNIRQQTREAVASDLGATLQPQGGAGIEAAQGVIQAQHDKLIRAAEAARDSAIEKGNREAISAFNDALAESRNNLKAAQQGAIAADAALEASAARLKQAGQQFAQAQRGRSRSDSSITVEEVLLRNAKEEKVLHDEAYAKAREETGDLVVDYTNTIEALKRVQKEAGKRGQIPDYLSKMIRDLIRKPDKNRVNRVEDIDSDYRNISGELSDTDNRTYQRWLGMVKDSLKADLETAGNASPLFARANRLFFDYARKYIDGPASGVVTSAANKKTSASKTIDAYTSDLESLMQLKESVKGDPAAQQAIDNWFVDKFSEEVGSAPTVKSMENWAMQGKNREFSRVFPSARAAVDKAQSAIRTAEAGVERAQQEKTLARELATEAKAEFAEKEVGAKQRETVIEREKRQQAKEAFRNEQERIQGMAVNKILGKDAKMALTSIFKSDDPVGMTSEIMATLRGNKQAEEGFKNALSSYLNENLRSNSRVETTLNKAEPVKPDEFAALFGKLNDFLTEGLRERAVLEKVYGKDSKEMKALDIIRKQYELLARPTRTTQGQSQTALRTAIGSNLSDINKNNSLGALQRIAAGLDEKVGAGARFFTAVSSLLRFASKGDPSKVALNILVEAQTNPKLAAELLRGQTPDSIKKLRPYAKFYGQKQSEKEEK
jgi:hypothetical protein